MGTYANITVTLSDGSKEQLQTGDGHPSILGEALVSAGFWNRTSAGFRAADEEAVMDFFTEEMGAEEGHRAFPDYEYFIEPGDLLRCYYRDTQEPEGIKHPLISSFVDNEDIDNADIKDLFRQLFDDFVRRQEPPSPGETASAAAAPAMTAEPAGDRGESDSSGSGIVASETAAAETAEAETALEGDIPAASGPEEEPLPEKEDLTAEAADSGSEETAEEQAPEAGAEAVGADAADSSGEDDSSADNDGEEAPEDPEDAFYAIAGADASVYPAAVSAVTGGSSEAETDTPSPKWVSRYFEIAGLVGTWSKDPSTKVGAIIVGDKGQIISQGYNGFPRGVRDTPERYNNREMKYRLVVHAEMNAILNALYNGSSVVGASIYIHNLPVCQECAKAIIQAGIARVFIDTSVNERWGEAWEISKTMFSESGVRCYYFDVREMKVDRII